LRPPREGDGPGRRAAWAWVHQCCCCPHGLWSIRSPGDPAARSAGVGAELVSALALAQLRHHFALDLPDPFPGQAERLADLVEGPRLAVVQAVAHADHRLLALFQGDRKSTRL